MIFCRLYPHDPWENTRLDLPPLLSSMLEGKIPRQKRWWISEAGSGLQVSVTLPVCWLWSSYQVSLHVWLHLQNQAPLVVLNPSLTHWWLRKKVKRDIYLFFRIQMGWLGDLDDVIFKNVFLFDTVYDVLRRERYRHVNVYTFPLVIFCRDLGPAQTLFGKVRLLIIFPTVNQGGICLRHLEVGSLTPCYEWILDKPSSKSLLGNKHQL